MTQLIMMNTDMLPAYRQVRIIILIFLFYFFIHIQNSKAQYNNVGIGTITPDSSAKLDITDTTKGILFPRLSTSQRNAIASPADGLTIYNTTDSVIEVFNGKCWRPTYAMNCNSCGFNISLSSLADTINFTETDSVQVKLTVTQFAGNPQNIVFAILGNLPEWLTYKFSNNPQFSSGTVNITFHAASLLSEGTYPIIIQGICDASVHTLIYNLTVTPCYELQILNDVMNYNLASAFYSAFPDAPTGSPVCINCTINKGVTVTDSTTSVPAFTTGNLPAGSHVTIINNGNIIGRGGDGGIGYDSLLNITGAGNKGGNAVNLTVDATIINNSNSYIFGGGGGGSGNAFSLNYNIPFPANINFGIFLGGGGGGGAGGGQGGKQPTNISGLVTYINAGNGTNGIFGKGGDGGILNYPLTILLGPVTISLNPLPNTAAGGKGGDYGANGTQGVLSVLLSATVIVNVPFIGEVELPVLSDVTVPTPTIPQPGKAGYAIKRNGHSLNIPDNAYNTSFLKGIVGP